MKKFKITSLSLIALVLALLSVFTCFADTIYEYFGLRYTLINNFSVSIYDRTDISESLELPDKIEDRFVTEIRSRAFMDDTVLENVSFSRAKHLEYIGSFAFKNCTNLNGELILPSSIKSINTCAFEDCSSITSLTDNSNATVIPEQCFNGCTNLSSVKLSDSIQSIKAYAFADCPQLKTIKLSKNITSIASSAFKNDDITIQGYMDSYAEEYADSKGIDFEAIDAIVGDANYDKTLNIQDVTAIQKYKAGLTTLSKSGLKAADVTGDGEVSVRDATQIQRYLANIITDF